jgi:hypothetical protein
LDAPEIQWPTKSACADGTTDESAAEPMMAASARGFMGILMLIMVLVRCPGIGFDGIVALEGEFRVYRHCV